MSNLRSKLPSLLSLFSIGTLIIISSCNIGTNGASREEAIGNETAGEPVEIRKPNAGYEPAFEGQTRAPGIKTNTAYDARIITDKLNKPWGIAMMPDGRMLITEKEGNMRIVSKDGKVSEKITGLPDVVAKGQGGLLGLALDPEFNTNKTVFWVFSEKSDKGTTTSLAKGTLSGDESRIENTKVIFRATPAYDGNNHYGGRIVFDKSGNIYLTTADRQDKEMRPFVQQLNNGLGKVIHITKDGQAVKGNPFEGREGASAEVYSYGHRNVQGIDIHPETGEVWVSEMGPRGGDELNRIEAGKNYGWPEITYGKEYSGLKISGGQTKKEGMEQPVYFWDPVLSPSGMAFYKGNAIPEWKNNLFIGGLNSNHIARLVIEGNKVVGEERLLADQKQRFRAVIDGNDGALYAITDEGRLYRIGKK